MRVSALPYKPWSVAVLFGNYTRLGVTFALGILGLRVASDLGSQTFAAVFLVLGMRWLFAVLPAAVEAALVPVMGRVSDTIMHRQVCRVLTFGLFAVLGLWCVRSVFDFGGLVGWALYWPFVWTGLHLVLHMQMAPYMAHLIASGRMTQLNVWVIARRLLDTAPLILIWSMDAGGAEQIFFVGSVLTGVALAAWGVCPMTVPPASTSEVSATDLGRGIKATMMQGAGTALLMRGSVIMVNVVAGAEATVIFGVTFALLGYVRQATTGLVMGLDGRAARDTASRLVDITQRATWVQSIWVTFGTVAIILLSELLIDTLMPAIDDLQQQQIANLLGIMVFGMALRAIGDCWIKILNGAGHAPQFGSVLFFWVLVYLVALATTLGFGQPYVAAAYLFCTVQAVLFGGVLPCKLSHVIEIFVWRLLAPIAVTLGPVALWVLSRG